MQDQKIKFWFADRKKVSKTRIPNRAARKGQFYKPHQLNLSWSDFHLIAKLPYFRIRLNLPNTLSKPHIIPSYKPVLCLLPPKNENFKQWTYILFNHQMWAYHLFSVTALTRYISTKHTRKAGGSQIPMSKKHTGIVQLFDSNCVLESNDYKL